MESVWRTIKRLAGAIGPFIPSSSYVERRVQDEYFSLKKNRGLVSGSQVKSESPIMCPSYPQRTNAVVFARRGPLTRSFKPVEPSDTGAIESTTRLPEPAGERRIRLAGRCVSEGCVHWTGSSCHLGTVVASVSIKARPLSGCAIRSSCRWYLENAEAACRACKFLPYSTLFEQTQEKSPAQRH